jgi:hypothetical protein
MLHESHTCGKQSQTDPSHARPSMFVKELVGGNNKGRNVKDGLEQADV